MHNLLNNLRNPHNLRRQVVENTSFTEALVVGTLLQHLVKVKKIATT
jgi:hypothetical protein